MNAVTHSLRTSSAVFRVRRVLTVLALALALIAIPAFSPGEASARRMSEGTVNRICASAGGRVHYNFISSDFGDYTMSCKLPSGSSFHCSSIGGPFGNLLYCA